MKAPLYNEILDICQSMAQASSDEDAKAGEVAHQALQKLCQTNQGTPKDHPLQWEALADFTHDGDQALDIYQLALNCAEKLNLTDSKASVLLAIAQRHTEFEDAEKALKYATKAHDLIAKINNDELKNEVDELFKLLTKT